MKEDYSQAAADLISKMATRSRATAQRSTHAINTDGLHLVINRAEHCTFILGAAAAAAMGNAPKPDAELPSKRARRT